MYFRRSGKPVETQFKFVKWPKTFFMKTNKKTRKMFCTERGTLMCLHEPIYFKKLGKKSKLELLSNKKQTTELDTANAIGCRTLASESWFC